MSHAPWNVSHAMRLSKGMRIESMRETCEGCVYMDASNPLEDVQCLIRAEDGLGHLIYAMHETLFHLETQVCLHGFTTLKLAEFAHRWHVQGHRVHLCSESSPHESQQLEYKRLDCWRNTPHIYIILKHERWEGATNS